MAATEVNMAQDVIIQNNWEFCDLCQDDDEINWKCLQCRQHLCERCKTGHINGRITREHLVFPKEKKNEEEELVRLYTCETHANQNIIMYCKTDKIPVCTMCVDEGHQGHILVSLGKVADDKRKEIEQTIEPGKKLINITDTELKAIRENGEGSREWNFYARKQVLETKTEIEKVLNVIATEMMDEYDRKCLTYSNQCIETELKLATRRTFIERITQEAEENVRYLRDIEIIRKSDSILQNAQILNKSTEAKREKPLQFAKLEIHKADLRKSMLEALTRDSYHIPVAYNGGSPEYSIAVCCIYIGANQSFVQLSLFHDFKEDFHNPRPLCFHISNAHIVVDEDMSIIQIGNADCPLIIPEEKNVHHHCVSMQQVIMKDGKIDVISESGKHFDGNELFQAFLLHLKSIALDRISHCNEAVLENEIIWQIIYPEHLSDSVHYLAKDFDSNIKVKNWSLCSDAEACIRYRSKIPNNVSLTGTPCVVLEIGESITISTRHVNKNGDSTILQKPLLCPGLSDIPRQWINIMKHLVGEENVSPFTWRTQSFQLIHSFLNKFNKSTSSNRYRIDCEIVERLDIPLQQSEYAKDITIRKRDIIQISKELVERQVGEIMTNVCMNITHIMSMPGMPPISSLLLLGEFCNHPMIKEAIQSFFTYMYLHISSETYDSVTIGGIYTACPRKWFGY